MATAARRGLARGILVPLRPAAFPIRTTVPAATRAATNAREAMREAMRQNAKSAARMNADSRSPASEMQGQSDAMRNRFLLPGTLRSPFHLPTFF